MMSAYFLKSTVFICSTSVRSAVSSRRASVRSSNFSRSAVACSSKTFATSSGVSKGMRRFLMSPKEKPRCFRDRI